MSTLSHELSDSRINVPGLGRVHMPRWGKRALAVTALLVAIATASQRFFFPVVDDGLRRWGDRQAWIEMRHHAVEDPEVLLNHGPILVQAWSDCILAIRVQPDAEPKMTVLASTHR